MAQRQQMLAGWVERHLEGFGVGDQYNNVFGVLQFLKDEGLGEDGSWSSWVDSTILHGIQGGIAVARGTGDGMGNPAAERWARYLRAVSRGEESPLSNEARRLWSVAEETATLHGYAVARQRGAGPTGRELSFAGGAHVYRAGLRRQGGVDAIAILGCGVAGMTMALNCVTTTRRFLSPSTFEATYYGAHGINDVVDTVADAGRNVCYAIGIRW